MRRKTGLILIVFLVSILIAIGGYVLFDYLTQFFLFKVEDGKDAKKS